MQKKTNKSKQIINKLNEIIEIAKLNTRKISLRQELILKLASSLAISLFIIYFTMLDQHLKNGSYNFFIVIMSIIFTCVMSVLLLEVYMYKNATSKKVVLCHICQIISVSSGTFGYAFGFTTWNLPKSLDYSLLYISALFAMTIALMFGLLDSFYPTPRYADTTLFYRHRDLIMTKLVKFNNQEIDSAILHVDDTINNLSTKLDWYVVYSFAWITILGLNLFLNLAFRTIFQSTVWFDSAMISSLIVFILISIANFFVVIKNISNRRKSDHHRQYWLILTEYYSEKNA